MKNTILFQIIKKTMLTEVLTEVTGSPGATGGFKPYKETPPAYTPMPVKTDTKTDKTDKKDTKKDTKSVSAPPEYPSILPKTAPTGTFGKPVIIDPPPARSQNVIFNKASDGNWYWEMYDAATDKLISGKLTPEVQVGSEHGMALSGMEEMLNKGQYKPWVGTYRDEKNLDKKTWLMRMDSYNPANPNATRAPMLSTEALTTLMTVAYWGGMGIGLIVTGLIAKRFGALPKLFNYARLFVQGTNYAELATLGGMSEKNVLNMKQFTEGEYLRGNLSRKQRNQLRGIYDNQKWWRVVSTETFNGFRTQVIMGDMTMTELITFMPEGYARNPELRAALYKYERDVLNLYPGREAKFQKAAAKYLETIREYDRKGALETFKKQGYVPPVQTAADIKKAKKVASDKEVASTKAAAAAKIKNNEDMVTNGIRRTSAKVKEIKNKELAGTYHNVFGASEKKLGDWEVFLGSGTRNGTAVNTLISSIMSNYKNKEQAILEIKKFAVKYDWSKSYNLEARKTAIDEFLTQFLPNF